LIECRPLHRSRDAIVGVVRRNVSRVRCELVVQLEYKFVELMSKRRWGEDEREKEEKERELEGA